MISGYLAPSHEYQGSHLGGRDRLESQSHVASHGRRFSVRAETIGCAVYQPRTGVRAGKVHEIEQLESHVTAFFCSCVPDNSITTCAAVDSTARPARSSHACSRSRRAPPLLAQSLRRVCRTGARASITVCGTRSSRRGNPVKSHSRRHRALGAPTRLTSSRSNPRRGP